MSSSSSHDKTKNSKGTEGERLDLGFSKLISSLNEEEQQGVEPTGWLRNTDAKISEPKSTTTKTSDNKYVKFAQSGSWQELRKLSESNMSGPGSELNPEATIWWIKSQLELQTAPTSILAAPLEQASARIEKFSDLKSAVLVKPDWLNSELREVTASVLMTVACHLLPSLSDRHAIPFLRRVVAIDPGSSEKVIGLLKKELSRLSTLTGRKKQREERESDINGALRELERFTASEAQRAVTPPPIVSELDAHSTSIVGATKRGLRSTYLVAVLLVAILYYFRNHFLQTGGDKEIFQPVEVVADLAKLQPPTPDRVKTLNNLDAVLYGIDGTSNANRSSSVNQIVLSKEERPPPEVKLVEPEKVLEDPPKSPSEITGSSSATAKKEVIDTSGPIEGTIFYPEIGDSRSRVDDDRRLFPDSKPTLFKNPQDTGTGSMYRVLTKTRVMSKPSYFAVSLAMLDPGARIEVIERAGEWLKVRSRMGQVGYILTQDAEPLS